MNSLGEQLVFKSQVIIVPNSLHLVIAEITSMSATGTNLNIHTHKNVSLSIHVHWSDYQYTLA